MRPSTTTVFLALPLALATLVTCTDSRAPTAAGEPERPSAELAAGADASDVRPLGTLALPVNQTFGGIGVALGITQTGSGPAAFFKINQQTSGQTALLGETNGSGAGVRGRATFAGNAGVFESTNPNNSASALYVVNNGVGISADVRVSNANNTNAAVAATQFGLGKAGQFVVASGTSQATALDAFTNGVGMAGRFLNNAAGNRSHVLDVSTNGSGDVVFAHDEGAAGRAGVFQVNKSNNSNPAIFASTVGSGGVLVARSDGTGAAGQFFNTTSTGAGVVITTAGGPGLQVFGGSKNAVVSTASGVRALYTEESSEVWFTDYGFGKLEHGRARILFDPTFAQTVNVDEPYHVFVQPRGRAELYVGGCTPLGFEVLLKDGDADAEFSYRVVAKRKGFERDRLDPAPWAGGVSDTRAR